MLCSSCRSGFAWDICNPTRTAAAADDTSKPRVLESKGGEPCAQAIRAYDCPDGTCGEQNQELRVMMHGAEQGQMLLPRRDRRWGR